MATTNITVRHRPARIDFLVRPGELGDLEKAANICSLLWGGIHNPIIPVNANDDANARLLVKQFQVDVLYAVADSDAISQFVAGHPYLMNPRLSARELFHEDWKSKKKKIAYLDVLNAIDKYWDKEFRHKPPEYQSRCRLISWDDTDRLKELFALSFGAYPTHLSLQDDFREGFVKGLRSKETSISSGDGIDPELVQAMTPMRLTGVDLQGYQGSFRTWVGGVYFGDAKSFTDLATFWNTRATGVALEFASLPDLPRLEEFIKAHLKLLDEQPKRHPNIDNHIAICYRGSHEEIADTLKKFPTATQILFCQGDNSYGGYLAREPAMFCFDWDFALGLVENEAGRFSVTVTLPDKKFLVDSQRSPDEQSLAVSLEPLGTFGFPDHTLSPPYRPELNEFYSRAIRFDPWAVRSEPEGIGVLITTGTKTLHLYPIAELAIMEALLGQAGLKAEPSAGGRLADRLLERLSGLEGTRVFKIRGVRQLVAGLTSQASVGRGDATKAIWNNGQFKEHERLHIERRDTPTLKTESTFDFLLRNEFFRAGLELKCEYCGLKSWLSLRQIDDDWICEYCGRKNATSLQIRNRGDWRFHKSGLLAKDNNQEGAIPVLLSLLVLNRLLKRGDSLRMTSANITGSVPKCEIDFMYVHHRHGKIEWALGEAKSAGGNIDADDVVHVKDIANQLKKTGVTPYLVFSKAADGFTPEELELFKTAHKEGYSVILFTNKEIEPYDPYYEDDDKDDLPHKYAHSFDEMVRNSTYMRPEQI